MSAASIFKESIPARFNNPDEREKMLALDAVFRFNLSGDEAGSWYVDFKNGECGDGDREGDCTINMDSADFVDLYNGDAQGAMLFMQQKLSIEGDMGLALKLMEIIG